MPVSILRGRAWPQPGEPLFTREDTDYAVALAEEEADTCSMCGLPKAVCRDPEYQFAFEPHEEQCHAAYTTAAHYESETWQGKHEPTRRATVVTARFREGRAAPIDAGLDLNAPPAGEQNEPGDQ